MTVCALLLPARQLSLQMVRSLSLVRSLSMRSKKNSSGDVGKFMIPKYSPKTANQKTYVDYLGDESKKIVVGVGAAGSGKTLFACCQAVADLKRGAIQKIIMTRPVVSVEEDIGFLPGSLIHKMDPWTRPIFDILLEFYTQKDIDSMLHGGVIEISPLGYMRGRTFKRAFIIADEMQNSSPNQMLMLATRLGEESKMVVTGDLKQSDRGVDNGLADFVMRLKGSAGGNEFGFVELGVEDVQRSAIVAKVLDLYAQKPGANHSSVANNSSVAQKPVANNSSVAQKPGANDSSVAMANKIVADNRIKIRGAINKMMIDYDSAAIRNGGRIDNDAAMLPSYEVPKKGDSGKRV